MSWDKEDEPSWRAYAANLITFFFGIILTLILIRIYNYLTLKLCYSQTNLRGKTVLITGANSGIGKETALDMARRDARVIMACRNTDKAEEAKKKIIMQTKNTDIVVRKLDLSCLKSVRQFAHEINQTEPRLDILIHNAGVANTFDKRITEDGLEVTMATNQYGPFLLTHLLIDLLKKSKPSRIVIVTSELYRFARLSLSNPNPIHGLPAYLYYVSKYANILFTLELAQRLEGSGVTANCLHPGMVDSGIWRNVPFPLNIPLWLIVKTCFKTAREGAQTTIYCAVSQALTCTNGKYFSECQETQLNTDVTDELQAKKYWEICENLVQLKINDPHI
ncbi:hypothetical protein V9T40_010592 [Parthenolecanium corni]|uniref:Retinol dehydrogenase 14 n=1 Tax=Parthenolecanium corni TaxID=536013 RepID=A0AAN9XXB9_9HEMI